MQTERGKAKKKKLDKRYAEIRKYLEMGISEPAICKLLDCAPSVIYQRIERQS